MRWALALSGLLVAGCNVTRTVPLASADRYFAGKAVVTREGYPLHFDDGGQLSPIARKGFCLEQVGEEVIAVGDRDVALTILDAQPGSDCASLHPVGEPLRGTIGDDTLTIIGRKRAVRVPTNAVSGLRVHAPRNDADAPLDAEYKTEPRSIGLAIAGAVFAAGGVAGAIAAWLERPAEEHDPHPSPDFYTGMMIFSLAAGVGGGTTMMAIGGTQVRAPVEARVGVGVGSAGVSLDF